MLIHGSEPARSPTPLPANAATIDPRYHLDRVAARTEAGVVYEASDRRASRRVAIEIASSIHDSGARARWARDGRTAQRLEGEHVLHVLDVGALSDETPYLVREVAVCTLAEEVGKRGALPVPEAVGWTLEACEALAEGHALGMAHGDLRPDNVYLARAAAGLTVKVAWTKAAQGGRAAKADIARDIEALGSLLRVLVTGQFEDELEGARTLPTALAHVIARSLAHGGGGGFQNVAELARMLAPFAPPGHASARSIAFMLSRAGVVSATIPLETRSPLAQPYEKQQHSHVVTLLNCTHKKRVTPLGSDSGARVRQKVATSSTRVFRSAETASRLMRT